MLRKTLFGCAAAALVLGLGMIARAGGGPECTAVVGQPAPAFTLQDQNGSTVSLASFAGKVVVLEWFNDGCPFVQKHYTSGNMNAVASKYMDKGVVWLAINSTKGVDNAHNKKIAADWKMNRPILNDASGATGKAYAAKTTPHMYIVNQEGNLVYIGAIDSDTSPNPEATKTATNYVAAALDDVLAGKAVAKSETKSYGCSVKYAN